MQEAVQTPAVTAAGRVKGRRQPFGARSLGRKLLAYVALTKPRVVELLLVTTAPVMVLAAHGIPNLWLVLATLVGGALSAGSANAFNCYIDRDIDRVMKRTQKRPLVTGELTDREAFKRAAEPWEVANVMVFLASDYASYLTGEVVSVSSQHA